MRSLSPHSGAPRRSAQGPRCHSLGYQTQTAGERLVNEVAAGCSSMAGRSEPRNAIPRNFNFPSEFPRGQKRMPTRIRAS